MGAAAECKDLPSFSEFLGFAPQRLYFLIGNPKRLYKRIELDKRSSGKRQIDIPSRELKGVQRTILRRIIEQFSPTEMAFAYVKGRSAIAAARRLCGRQNVFRVDLKDFFPSIDERRVYGLFRKEGFNEKVAFFLTRLTTVNGVLPQGAPTSPHISNLICRSMDLRLNKLSERWRISYLRYSDDLFFYSPSNFNPLKFLRRVENIVRENGFRLGSKKTRYFPKGVPRTTLGLLTHGKTPRLPGKQRKIYRFVFFKAARNPNWGEENFSQLSGMLEYFKAVYGVNDRYQEYRKVLVS